MRSRYAVAQTMDLVRGRRVTSSCWLSASLGISIMQLRLLMQAWQISQHALVPACVMSAWTIGSLMGTRVRNISRVWGSSCLVCALLWLGYSSLVSWRLSLSMASPVVGSFVALAMVAWLLGGSSTVWLSQQRTWPSVGERATLIRSLVGLTVGLVTVWLLPSWASLVAVSCCLPLLMLDVLPAWRGPLPVPGGVAASWVGRYWTADRWQPLLDQRVLSRTWWRSSLVERSPTARGDLPLTLLASGVTVILGSIWGAIPTPFAAALRAGHALGKLEWLLGGQLGILVVSASLLLLAARGTIGFSHRPLPTAWQPRLRTLLVLMPVGMAGSLVALGLPFLQAPWWLALSLVSYTLADAIWSMLLPRLKPGLETIVLQQHHLHRERSMGWPDMVQLAYRRACEAHANLLLATCEGLLIAAITPVIGWMIDWRGSVDAVLIMVGLVFLLSLVCALGGHAFRRFARQPFQGRSGLTFPSTYAKGSVFPKVKTAAYQ